MLAFGAVPGALARIALAHGHYLIPRADGTVLAGSTLEETGFDASTTSAARTGLERFATALLPALRDAPVVAQWSGLRPGSDDGVPTIAPHPVVAGLWVNAGHYRNGVVMAPASAELLARLVAAETPDPDPAPYAWPPE
ncbi:MAG: FAD-dependent oxidoreductase [Halofilum sp. (in: g-proteobacteria)]|nr:FAD-dependent oxidoreductase [Halofilum sp. (in: g-proteobacteria)]